MLADRPAIRLTSSSSGNNGGGGGNAATPQQHHYTNPSSYSSMNSNNNGVTIDASGSIGNFKGVMLCNRPDPMDGVGRGGNDQPTAFRVPSKHETFHPNGQNTELSHLRGSRRRIRVPNPTIMKVKAYLQELSDKKFELLQQKQEEEARLAEKHARIAESQRILRELIRNNTGDDTNILQENNRTANVSNAYHHLPPVNATRKDPNKTVDFTVDKGPNKNAKPAWARSEATVAAAEEKETEDLLDFANNLDYDNYVDDLEDKAGETLVNRRLREVESEEAQERAKLQALEAEDQAEADKETAKLRRERRRRRARRKARRKAREDGNEEEKKESDQPNADGGIDGKKERTTDDSDWDNDSDNYDSNIDSDHSTAGEDGGYDSTDTATKNHPGRKGRNSSRYNSDDEDDDENNGSDEGNDTLGPLHQHHHRGGKRNGGNDAASIATSVLSSASSIRNIHSKKSLTQIIARTQAEEQHHQNLQKNSPYEGQVGATTLPINNPKIIVHNDYKEALDNKKNLISNLPYQHRNPAI